MNSSHLTEPMSEPQVPRDPPPVSVDPHADRPVTLHLVYDPMRVTQAALDASEHRARQAAKREAAAAMDANLLEAQHELTVTQMRDTTLAERVAHALPSDRPLQDRRQAGAVAVRLHDPIWQTLARYRASHAALTVLRKLLVANGVHTIADSDLRQAAHDLARVTHLARMRTWDGAEPVKAREWAGARLSLLDITGER